MSNLLFCKKCAETKEYLNGFTEMSREHKDFIAGYLIGYSDKIHRCPYCKNEELISIPITNSDFDCIMEVSKNNKEFLNAMINLAQKDPIEYQLKMSQFKTNLAQQKVEEQNDNTPKCPTCNSTNIKKISSLSKAGSVVAFGLFSRKIHKQWHCNNCGSEW